MEEVKRLGRATQGVTVMRLRGSDEKVSSLALVAESDDDVELPGEDHRPWLGDVESLLTHIEVFVAGRKGRPRRRVAIGADALSRREREVALIHACDAPPA